MRMKKENKNKNNAFMRLVDVIATVKINWVESPKSPKQSHYR